MATSSCPHIGDFAKLRQPRLADSVHREECTQCFDDQDSPLGVDVCLTCFNGGCLSVERHHARTHASKTEHKFVLNVKRKPKPSANREQSDEPPTKMAKLAIVADREEDKYEHVTTFRCYACDSSSGKEITGLSASPEARQLINGILQSMSSGRQSEVQAWEEEITPCEHTLMLEQLAMGPIAPSGLAHCGKCDLKENLWLCLACGSLGCGRQQYGGTGGNGHGLAHFEESKHPVSVKLGTITPEGTADVYCYICNDSKTDPDLAAHLSTFGINIQTQTKTEKSMTELQIEHNLKFDFSLTGEDGKALEPVFGPGLTGLSNLGNSCYMASVIQTLFSLPPFQNAYFPTAQTHWESCTEAQPASCLQCQMHKLADGLLSGRYSHPRPTSSGIDPKATNPLAHDVPKQDDAPVAFQDGVKPAGFKTLVGKGHAEFATMRQQDAEEFFGHLLESLRRDAKRRGEAEAELPTEIFRFGLEQRLQCTECKGVRYRVDSADALSTSVPASEKGKNEDGTKFIWEDVLLEDCVKGALGEEELEYKCPRCNKTVVAAKATRLATFPDVLVVHAKKFQLVNWVPSKLDIPVILPADDTLVLDSFLGHGVQPGEDELPEEKPEAPGLPEFNEVALGQLTMMGFPELRSKKALLATGNSDPEAAMEWLFAHMEDADIDAPLQAPTATGSGSAPEPSVDQISMLADMGFTHPQARKALRQTGGNAERAVEWLFSHPDDTGEDAAPGVTPSTDSAAKSSVGGSTNLPARFRLKAFVSHKGPSVHSGHYVAHIHVESNDDNPDEGWVLFNDEKVVKADAESVRELKRFAYLYIFERV